MERYDIAIIGTGPAGLSAAITAKIRKKNVILFGSKASSVKVQKAHTVQNYLGLPNASGADLQQAFTAHLAAMEIAVTEEKITTVYPMGDYFSMQSSNNTIYEASAVILATGVTSAKAYPGETEYLGRGVSYCATCDAALYRGKTAAVIGANPDEEREAELLAQYAEKVYYLPLYAQEVNLPDTIEVIRETPTAIEGGFKVNALVTDKNRYEVDGVFVLRESVAAERLVTGLQTDGAHIPVDRSMATNLAGCFACGDVTGTPYQYIKAAGEGNVAALSAAAYLYALRREKKGSES